MEFGVENVEQLGFVGVVFVAGAIIILRALSAWAGVSRLQIEAERERQTQDYNQRMAELETEKQSSQDMRKSIAAVTASMQDVARSMQLHSEQTSENFLTVTEFLKPIAKGIDAVLDNQMETTREIKYIGPAVKAVPGAVSAEFKNVIEPLEADMAAMKQALNQKCVELRFTRAMVGILLAFYSPQKVLPSGVERG